MGRTRQLKFGDLTASTGSSANSFRYTGREWDAETSLYYYRARYYHPAVGRFLGEDPLFVAGGDLNLYRYTWDNPVVYRDPKGLYGGLDDAVFAGGGAIIGVFGQGVSDLLSGQLSSWQNYASAAGCGAVGGEALLYTGPVISGGLAGACVNAVNQALRIHANPSCKWSWKSFTFDTGVGLGLGAFGGVTSKGLTSGRNSFNAIYRQMVTKYGNGTAGNIGLSTALKMFAGRAADTGLVPGAAVGGAIGAVKSAAGSDCGCN